MFERVAKALLVGGLTGKVVAALRELITAWFFGTGVIASAYRVSQAAFLIPINGAANELLNAGFSPIYRRMHAKDPAAALSLFRSIHRGVICIAILVSTAIWLLAERWIDILAPGLTPETGALATQMVQVMTIAMAPFALNILYTSTELAQGRTFLASARSSFQSAGLILGTIAAWLCYWPLAIPVSFLVTYTTLAVWGYFSIKRHELQGLMLHDTKPQVRKACGELIKVAPFLLLMPIAMQIHYIVERRAASNIDQLAIPALDYARFIQESICVLIAFPFGLAGLATMSSMSREDFERTAVRSLSLLAHIGIPASALIFVLAEPLVAFMFQRGAFDAPSALATANVLRGASVGLWAAILGYVSLKYAMARGRAGKGVSGMLVSVAVNVSLNMVLPQYMGHAALGVSSSVAAITLATLSVLFLGLIRPVLRQIWQVASVSLVYAILGFALSAQVSAQLLIAFTLLYWLVAIYMFPELRALAKRIVRSATGLLGIPRRRA